MRTIGIRSMPKEVFYAIVETEPLTVVNVDKIKIPLALPTPEALKYLRGHVLDILREYDVTSACIRITETNAQNLDIQRIQIEGVLQECFASSHVSHYFAGQIANISSKIGIEREQFKKAVEGENLLQVENWADFKSNEREAVLAAIGAINA